MSLQQSFDEIVAQLKEVDEFPIPIGEPWSCQCSLPVPEERAERKGAARTYCVRCDRPVPIRFAW